ncbi:MAG: hypothetical protein QM817_29435 [Archangium sp.]
MLRVFVVAVSVVSMFSACAPEVMGPAPRAPGVRAPLSASCGALDETRCLLPWPSNEYTVADETSATGLRVALNWRSLPVRDTPASLNALDGFSVVTPLAVGFPRPVAHQLHHQRGNTGVKLFSEAREVPLRLTIVNDTKTTDSMLIALPEEPLEYATDYVAVVLDSVTDDDGAAFEQPALVKVALGLTPATTESERALFAYHAPTRALLTRNGVELEHVLRVWDFTTRSADGVVGPLQQMRTAAIAANLTVVVESAKLLDGASGIDVRGRVEGLPKFLDDMGGLSTTPLGTHVTPFRAVLPAGTGSYHVVIYGHGTGGTVNDDTFDREIIGVGAAKLNLQWDGWTETTTVSTLVSFEKVYSGTVRSTNRLMQSLADAAALQASLGGALGDALSAAQFGTLDNPAAGRHPDMNALVYAGGSLGGTMGYVLSQASPDIHFAVLNVPGAGWSHFSPESELWSTLDLVFQASTPSPIDRALGVAMSQANLDSVDGAAWAAAAPRSDLLLLEQMSIGDPVLPNVGSRLVATSSHAVQLGAIIDPITDAEQRMTPLTQNAMTQFRVPASVTGLSIHGFAAGDSNAGLAAREQIAAFIASVWAGAPKIEVPARCASRPNQSCDFSADP